MIFDKELERKVLGLEAQVCEMRKEMPLGKKVAIGLGLTFLSACTVRYWINKLEPVLESYAQRHAVQRTVTQDVKRNGDYSDIDKALEVYHAR